MYHTQNELGDSYFLESIDVATEIDMLEPGDEISFTYDRFLSEQLYDTVLEGLSAGGYKCELNCGVWRWFFNPETRRTLVCDFRNDVIIVRRGPNYEERKER